MKEQGYKGEEIDIHEYPFGCGIVFKVIPGVVRSPSDAKALIESLSRMVEIFGEEDD